MPRGVCIAEFGADTTLFVVSPPDGFIVVVVIELIIVGVGGLVHSALRQQLVDFTGGWNHLRMELKREE